MSPPQPSNAMSPPQAPSVAMSPRASPGGPREARFRPSGSSVSPSLVQGEEGAEKRGSRSSTPRGRSSPSLGQSSLPVILPQLRPAASPNGAVGPLMPDRNPSEME